MAAIALTFLIGNEDHIRSRRLSSSVSETKQMGVFKMISKNTFRTGNARLYDVRPTCLSQISKLLANIDEQCGFEMISWKVQWMAQVSSGVITEFRQLINSVQSVLQTIAAQESTNGIAETEKTGIAMNYKSDKKRRQTTRGKNERDTGKNMRCFRCNKLGHLKRNSPKNKRNDTSEESSDDDAEKRKKQRRETRAKPHQKMRNVTLSYT